MEKSIDERFTLSGLVPDRGFVLFEELPGGARARYILTPLGDRIVVSEVSIKKASGVTARGVRETSPALAVEVFEDEFRRSELSGLDQVILRLLEASPDWQDYVAAQQNAWRPWRAALARGRSDGRDARLHRLLETAVLYADALNRNDRRPNETVAAQQGRSASRVRDDVKAARAAGLLEAAGGRGVPGGHLTTKARALIGTVEENQ